MHLIKRFQNALSSPLYFIATSMFSLLLLIFLRHLQFLGHVLQVAPKVLPICFIQSRDRLFFYLLVRVQELRT